MSHTDKDRGHVIGGLKAAITNPRTSPEAKESAAERLRELEEPVHHELGSHQISGYKATISNPNTSEKAKRHAREVLAEDEEEVDTRPEQPPPVSADDRHHKRVLAGHKSTLRNANTSQDAKERAKVYLREHGENV